MNITAEHVQKTCASSQIIEGEIKTILKTFQSEILEASKNGATNVIVAVPTNFNIANMSNKMAQTIIYHRLIGELEEKGFVISIALDDASTTYCVKWDVRNDADNLEDMRSTIASRIVNNKKEKSDTRSRQRKKR